MTIGAGVIPWMLGRTPSIRRLRFSAKLWKIPRRRRRRRQQIRDRARALKMEYPDVGSPVDPTLRAAMEDPMTVSLGPMGPLLRKLHAIGPEQRPPEKIRLLKLLCISLKNLSEDDDASCTAQWWMKIVRELCYDAEDLLDDGVSVASADFSEILARVADATERRERFQWSPKTSIKHDDSGDSSHCTPPDLLTPICGRGMVGVVETPNKLVDLLALDGDSRTLKVIPINGCAGVGKTTAARTLYEKYGGEFQCRAFVCFSRNPDVRRLLISMLSQIKAPGPSCFPDVPDLIDAIRKHLHDKRYFVVIDDVWTASVWDIISPAFPRGDRCSRIITTTQIDDVALACCSYDSDNIYNMSPVNEYESRQLFFSTVFGSEDDCPTSIKEMAYEIVKKCGGLPLAIVNIASLLASESHVVRENWKHIHDALCSTSDGMKVIVNLIYNSLPPSLRTCLLYLSMYPEGYVIMKGDLVRQWVAEGFLIAEEGLEVEETAERYFDELVSRGMVQAVDTNSNGEVFSCTVHHMVLDFIRCKSIEENFVITVNYFQSTLALADKVRRLSVQFGGVKSACIPESIITSQVRSFIFWGYLKCVPSIRDYGLLRVLILHIWDVRDNTSFDLTMIGQLLQLNYLKIEGNITVQLPDKIQSLQHLGTLHVDARLYDVPQDLVNLERLLHLRLPSECSLPRGFASMTSLRTLGCFDLNSESEENVLHLGQLTNLQDLQLTCSAVQPPAENFKKNVKLLGVILKKLICLQSVTLVPASGSSCADSISIFSGDGFSMVSPPPDLLLRRIELSWRCCIFFSLPRWFRQLSELCTLKIALGEVSREDIDVLKGLPSLTALTLHIQTAPAERVVIGHEGFRVLTYFKFVCPTPCLSFEQGAMARLEKLNLGFNATKMNPHSLRRVAFCNLIGLVDVCAKFGVQGGEEFDIKAAKTALEAAIGNHPNTPAMRVQCFDATFYREKDESTKEKENSTRNKRHDSRRGNSRNTEGSQGTVTEERKDKALEEQHRSQEGKNNKMESSKGENYVTEEIEDEALKKQHDIEEDKEEKTKCSGEESTATTEEEKKTKSSEQHVNKQDDSRMDGDTFQIPLMDYYIPDYILKPEAEQVIGGNAPVVPCCPVIVFINSRIGAQLGSNLIKTYRELLNEAQVFDLSEESPDKVLHRLYANFEKLKANGNTAAIEIQRNIRLIVAGGDGTASWLLGVVRDLKLSPSPPVATMPLGTGNNLSFSFGWGKKNPATDHDAVKSFLGLVKGARGMNIDSWHVLMRMRVPQEGLCDPIAPLELPHSLHAFHRVSSSDSLNVEGHHTFRGEFWNYFSMGMDAQVSYGFETENKKKPEKLKSLLTNLGTYAKLGRKGSLSSSRKISQLAMVTIMKKPGDAWKELKIPSSIRSIICLNLPSFSGGFNPWGKPGTKKSQDRDLTTPYVDDELIEIVGFRDAWRSLVLLTPNGHGTRLAQAHKIRFEFLKGAADHTFMGVDGEPWKQPLPNDDETVVIEISHLRQVTMLAIHPCKSKSIDDPMSPSLHGHDNDDNDSLEDEDEGLCFGVTPR